jgi:hypothetical protein
VARQHWYSSSLMIALDFFSPRVNATVKSRDSRKKGRSVVTETQKHIDLNAKG